MSFNVLEKFNLTEKEVELLDFVIHNNDSFAEEFSIHDVSCLGYVTTKTYYDNLYNKGLFLKPSRGKYSLNIELLERLARQAEEREKELKEQRKKKRMIFSLVWIILAIPQIIFGLLLCIVEPITGCLSIGIGIVELFVARKLRK